MPDNETSENTQEKPQCKISHVTIVHPVIQKPSKISKLASGATAVSAILLAVVAIERFWNKLRQ